jgi:acetyl-CoA carboxylase biotin carboxyl carrier protein
LEVLCFNQILLFSRIKLQKMEKKVANTTSKPETASDNTFDIQEINELLKAFTKSNVNELKLEKGDFKITIRQGAGATTTYVQAAPVAAAAPAPPSAAAPQVTVEAPKPAAPVADKGVIIKSPMIGTFYRSAGPGKPTFVNVGDAIEPGKPICIIEAMKLFNEIESEIKGTIIKVLVDDATPVEYDQPLFLVDPA